MQIGIVTWELGLTFDPAVQRMFSGKDLLLRELSVSVAAVM